MLLLLLLLLLLLYTTSTTPTITVLINVIGFTGGQARAQQFAAQLLNLCGDSPALSHAMIPVGFDVIQLQCQLDEQLLFVIITNDDTEPGELQR